MRTTRHGCRVALPTMTMPRATERGWSREFAEPIRLADGRELVTLRDAATYITTLPEAEHTAPEWQAAMGALMLVSRGGHVLLVSIGMLKALNRHKVREFNPSRRPALGTAQAGARPLVESRVAPSSRNSLR
jgi:hypothetical protein